MNDDLRTIQLRGDHVTHDPRLDRLPQFDPRSRSFPVTATIRPAQTTKPRSYTWSIASDLILDQGREGSCVGHAWAHEASARPSLALGADHEFARALYFVAQRIDPWDGGMYPGANPQYEGTSVLAGAKVAQSLGLFGSYYWSFSLSDLILAVGYRGPTVVGMNWYEGQSDPDSNGYIHPTGRLLGGHALIANKVSLKGEYFGLVNSWGRGWGKGGRCKITFSEMDTLLHQRGEACTPLLRRYERSPEPLPRPDASLVA